LQRIEGHPFNQQVAGEIVELHRDFTRAVSHRSVHSLTSFVSKYLHLHSRRRRYRQLVQAATLAVVAKVPVDVLRHVVAPHPSVSQIWNPLLARER